MLVLVSLLVAFGGDPPPAAAVAPLLRTCAEGQRCGDRCIPWTETCPAALRDALAQGETERRAAELEAALCRPTPSAPSGPAPTIEQQILVSVAAGALCGASGANEAGTCDTTARDPVPPRGDPPPKPPCGEAPPATPAR